MFEISQVGSLWFKQPNESGISFYPSNIAEGSNQGNKFFRHFLNISLGSSFELQTQLLIAFQNKYITEEQHRK
ncbi:MAG TPA: four helix bundle protein [Flavobacterium sp.]|nr:four helix bundle protein [Flavobacterium sp.]